MICTKPNMIGPHLNQVKNSVSFQIDSYLSTHRVRTNRSTSGNMQEPTPDDR